MNGMRILILPGWLDSGPGHWQSRWQQLHGWQKVEQADWQWPRRGDWMARLEDTVLESRTPVLLVAHSLGCHLVAAWAAHTRHADRVKGALLVAVPDLGREDTPPQLCGWRPVPRQRLPFAAIAVLSADDPYGALAASRSLVEDWGAAVSLVGPRGHLNAESGLGHWPEGLDLLTHLLPSP
jgi:predicted alpha/beta hydrolase family esterase